MSQSHLIPQGQALKFITAGNATFTFKSLLTGKWFTYKTYAKEEYGEELLVVKLLTGSDNCNSFSWLCTMRIENGIPTVIRDSGKMKDSLSMKTWKFVWTNLLLEVHMNNLEIWHEGTCCRCGRKLTVPESIASGIGPECANKVNKFQL